MSKKININAYLITDPSYYTHDIQHFKQKLKHVFKYHKPEYALYRDKEFENYAAFAKVFVELCQNYGIKSILHNETTLADKLGAYGVHYSSNQLCRIGMKSGSLFQILSTHKKEEILFAHKLGIDAVTFSPIFDSPMKGTPIGLDILKQISGTMPLPIIALGGILSPQQILAVKESGAWGFASIRYFFMKDI